MCEGILPEENFRQHMCCVLCLDAEVAEVAEVQVSPGSRAGVRSTWLDRDPQKQAQTLVTADLGRGLVEEIVYRHLC